MKGGASARRKGHAFERHVARELRKAMKGATVRRGLQFQDGSAAPDVVNPWFHIECKAGKKPNIRGAMRQAREANTAKLVPVVVAKDDRQEPLVAMELRHWLELVEAAWGGCNEVRRLMTTSDTDESNG